MKTLSYLLAAVSLAVPLSGSAQMMPPPPEHMQQHGGPGAPFLHGVELSEAQQDKVFAIMHARAPQQHENDKAMHKAQEALRALAASDSFDDAKAGAAAQSLGQAAAANALLRARTDAQIMALLSPEQRQQAARMPHPTR
ncbi:MAG: periplasmic heavy metal sensor [Pseudomonadota bacterium]